MDDKKLTPVVPRDVLVKQGISAIAYLAGGVLLLLMLMGTKGLLGLILPIAALVIGIAALLSRDGDDTKPGIFLTLAGLLVLLFRFLPRSRPFAGTILSLGTLGFFAAGIWQGVKFLIGLKSRT